MRPVIFPGKRRGAKAPGAGRPRPRHRPAAGAKFWVHQDVWYKVKGKKVAAKVLKVDKKTVDIHYYWSATKQYFTQRLAPKKDVTPQPVYKVGDLVRVWDSPVWRDGEVEQHAAKGRYLVFWTEDNQLFSKKTTGSFLRPR